jgi:hypothetical protein
MRYEPGNLGLSAADQTSMSAQQARAAVDADRASRAALRIQQPVAPYFQYSQ